MSPKELSGAAHELNNHLSLMIGRLDLLHMHLGPDTVGQEHVDLALVAALRATEVVRHIAETARDEAEIR